MTDQVWQGAPELEAMLVPVDDLVRHPRNPRRGPIYLPPSECAYPAGSRAT